MGYAKATLQGLVGRTPTLKTGAKDSFEWTLASFPIIVEIPVKAGKAISYWFDCVAFGEQAKTIVNSIAKDDLVEIAASIQKRKFIDKRTSETKYDTSFYVDNCVLLQKAEQKPVKEPVESSVNFEDIPF